MMEACVRDIDVWMTFNMLKKNRDNTELLVLNGRQRPLPPLTTISVCDKEINRSTKARNVGIISGLSMSMENHMDICKAAFFHLRNISRIRKYLSTQTAEILVLAFVSSRLDYCNSLLYGLPKESLKKLQHVQLNVAARIVTHRRKCDHITPVLCQLHWLPIEESIVFKNLLLTFNCLNGLAPPYLCGLITKYVPRRNLRSINGNRLIDVGYKLTRYGLRSFSVASAKLWNALPLDIRTSDNLMQFKINLKTHLFRIVFTRQFIIGQLVT